MHSLKLLAPVARAMSLLLFIVSVCAAESAPEVLKVEPPNWWPRHSINPVRVMIRGRNLAGARVEATGAGVSVTGPPKVNANGTYLFVDLSIAPSARPGVRTLRITTARGRVDAPFEILMPLARAGRFQGVTNDDIIYLIMPDRFNNGDRSNDDPAKSKGLFDRSEPRRYHGGDLRGIIDRLPYLKDLGVTAIWLNPWYDNTDSPDVKEVYDGKPTTGYHGYGAVDFYAVDEHLGDLGTLRELVEKAHAVGIKVIQDQVANHTGPYHPWVKDPPTPSWFNGTEAEHLNETWQTWALKDRHASPQVLRPVLDGWFINILPDLNQNDPEARRYIIQNTLWWVGATGLDAIRQDTLPYVPRAFWKDWMAAIKREHPRLNVIGETYDGDPAQVAFFQGGAKQWDGVDSGIDTEFDFPLFYAIRDAFAKGENVKKLAEVLSHDYLYANPDILVPFLGLHDMLRFMSEEKATREGLMLAQTFLMTTRGIPLVYYGDEIAMEGEGDPDNRRDFPGGFPGDGRDAFTSEGRTRHEREVFAHLKRVIRLRRELEPLRRGRLVTLAIADQHYAFARQTPRESVVVVFNNDKKEAQVEIDLSPLKLARGGTLVDRLTAAKDVRVDQSMARVTMPARSASVFTIK
ncbi:MAG TPA: alpha-amylase family glycosyl hydrolase [Blastocatellia bacterium]|jgi:glycosidase|nr:alpha-amylase family glycosyl hydrolase [Blastocatellia bacterium]